MLCSASFSGLCASVPACRLGAPRMQLMEKKRSEAESRVIVPFDSVPSMVGADIAMPPSETARQTWLPWLDAPTYLDGSLPGDAGLDPLCLIAVARPKPVGMGFDYGAEPWSFEARRSKVEQMSAEELAISVAWMRESEIKHGRLAMMAAIGWPLAERLNPAGCAAQGGRAPSLLNGGLIDFPGTPSTLGIGLSLAALLVFSHLVEASHVDKIADNMASWRARPVAYVEGDLGFDPLNIYEREGPQGQFDLRTAEVKHGRIAMLAVTTIALQEFVQGAPIVAR